MKSPHPADPGASRCVSTALPCGLVIGRRQAEVVEVRPWDVHGVGYVDVTVAYEDGALETARLGPESVPDDLRVGEPVMVSRAVNMIVAIGRP